MHSEAQKHIYLHTLALIYEQVDLKSMTHCAAEFLGKVDLQRNHSSVYLLLLTRFV